MQGVPTVRCKQKRTSVGYKLTILGREKKKKRKTTFPSWKSLKHSLTIIPEDLPIKSHSFFNP